MPEIGASDAENALISEAAEALRQRYPSMFKASRTCRPPHVNLDVLRNQIFETQLLKRHKLTTTDGLIDWLLQTNQGLAKQKWTLEKATRIGSARALQNALGKARDNDFFLGLSAEWPQHSS